MRIGIILLFALFIVVYGATVTLQPNPEVGLDTTIKQQYPTLNFGTAMGLAADGGGGEQQAFLIRFYMESYAWAIINEARLELYCYAAGTEGGTLNIHRVLTNWNENTVTWNTDPVIAAGAKSSALPNQYQWVSVDVTEFVQHWVNHYDENFGMRGSVAQDAWRSFGSSDRVNEAQRPKLYMNYQPASAVEDSSIGRIRAILR